MKNFAVFIALISLTASFGLPERAFASANLDVVFETGVPPAALFDEANFLPGDTVTRWAKVTNKTSASQAIVAKLANYSNPDGLGEQFDVVIKEHGAASSLFAGTMSALAAAAQVVLEPSLASNIQKQYDFSVTFRPEAGNPYQEKVLSFDFLISLQGTDVGGCEGADCGGGGGGGGGGGTTGGGGGGGGGGTTSDTGGQVLGENTVSSISMPGGPAEPGQVLGESLPKTGLPPVLWPVALLLALALVFVPRKKYSA